MSCKFSHVAQQCDLRSAELFVYVKKQLKQLLSCKTLNVYTNAQVLNTWI